MRKGKKEKQTAREKEKAGRHKRDMKVERVTRRKSQRKNEKRETEKKTNKGAKKMIKIGRK